MPKPGSTLSLQEINWKFSIFFHFLSLLVPLLRREILCHSAGLCCCRQGSANYITTMYVGGPDSSVIYEEDCKTRRYLVRSCTGYILSLESISIFQTLILACYSRICVSIRNWFLTREMRNKKTINKLNKCNFILTLTLTHNFRIMHHNGQNK